MDDLSEKEQLERIRSWWNENGNHVIVGVVAGLAIVFGVNYWRNQVQSKQVAASTQFEALANEVGSNRLDQAEEIAAGLYADYPDTVYAEQAHLAMARLYMDQGRDQEAADELRALLAGGGDTEMQLVGRLRLARILLYQGKAEDVTGLLEGHLDNAFGPRYREILGDAYVDLGRYSDARASYMAALEHERANQLVDAALIRMKVNDLPEETPADTPDESPAAPAANEAPDQESGA